MDTEGREYKGHRITVSTGEGEALRVDAESPELRIDDELVPYGQLPDGSYFLYDYAYDWTDNVFDLAKRFIDYQEKIYESRSESEDQ